LTKKKSLKGGKRKVFKRKKGKNSREEGKFLSGKSPINNGINEESRKDLTAESRKGEKRNGDKRKKSRKVRVKVKSGLRCLAGNETS
jgi:hypothetical protein